MEYTINNKYVVISQNVIQSRKYSVNKIIIGTLKTETDKSLIFETDKGNKRVLKRTISRLIDVSAIMNLNTQFFIDRIEAVLI